jgi:hypothetical protein
MGRRKTPVTVRVIAAHLKLSCDAPVDETETAEECEARLKKIAALQKELMGLFCREGPCGPWKPAAQSRAVIGQEFWGRQPGDRFYPADWQGMHASSLFDHPYFFRSLEGIYAIASHLYDCDAGKRLEIERFCDRYGLCAEYPDFPSWHYPTRTTFVWWTNLKAVAS